MSTTMATLKPQQLQELLAHAFALREPVVIVGKPGIGKTDITEQVAHTVGADFIRSHPALDDPTDGKGLPGFTTKGTKKEARFFPIGQFRAVLNATRPTIWLLDDFLQAEHAVQKTYMQWMHGRECAGHRLPDDVHLILATNDRTHRAGATGMLEPIKSRATIVELQEDREQWCDWLFEQSTIDGVPLSIDLIAEQVAFVRFREDLFCHFDPNTDLRNSPNPRTWMKALKWFTRDNLSTTVLQAAISGVVGEAAAVERVAFRTMYRELPTIEAILMDPTHAPIPDKPSILYAVAKAVATRATEDNAERVLQYVERLVEQDRGEFGTYLIREACRHTPALQHTPAFVRATTGALGQLIGAASG